MVRRAIARIHCHRILLSLRFQDVIARISLAIELFHHSKTHNRASLQQ